MTTTAIPRARMIPCSSPTKARSLKIACTAPGHKMSSAPALRYTMPFMVVYLEVMGRLVGFSSNVSIKDIAPSLWLIAVRRAANLSSPPAAKHRLAPAGCCFVHLRQRLVESEGVGLLD